jgi:hypothetical protein
MESCFAQYMELEKDYGSVLKGMLQQMREKKEGSLPSLFIAFKDI